MRAEKLEYLQKKYESRLNPAKDDELSGKGSSMPKGHGHGGMGNMAGGKPKNMKRTMGRLFGISVRDWGNGSQSGRFLYAAANHQRSYLRGRERGIFV